MVAIVGAAIIVMPAPMVPFGPGIRRCPCARRARAMVMAMGL